MSLNLSSVSHRFRSKIARVAFLRVCLAGVACLTCGSSTAPATSPRIVLLISIDTLRADHLGAYGYTRPTSPVLDALAEKGTVFEDVTATSSWTLPSHASLLTGLYPSRHGLRRKVSVLLEDVPTLAQVFRRAGFETAAAVGSIYLTQRSGLQRGFDAFEYFVEDSRQMSPTKGVTDAALRWVDAGDDAKRFIFLHYYDVHSDYRSEPRFEALFADGYDGDIDGSVGQLAKIRLGEVPLPTDLDLAHWIALYDAGIRQLDDELGRLFRGLRERGVEGETLIAITSDHGEEFVEHGGVLHGKTHYQEAVRIPLLLQGPNVPVLRITTPISQVDVAPTLLALAGVPPGGAVDGRDLTPLLRGETAKFETRSIFVEADWRNEKHDIKRAVRRGPYTLHYDRLTHETELYDLRSDPGEQRDISNERPEVVEELTAVLAEFASGAVRKGPERKLMHSEAMLLKSLGYIDDP